MPEIDYKKAGVDTKAGEAFVARIQELKKTSELSPKSPFAKMLGQSSMNFVAWMDISFLKDYKEPLLLSAIDGVGTKIHLAQLFSYYDGIGIDLVAMCANDILCSGGRTIQFLDYIACAKLEKKIGEAILASILKACNIANCVLVGGETAEHPNTMPMGQYDLAGFAIGVLEKKDLIDGSQIQEGDLILGLPSRGVHANGLSLVRKLYLKEALYLPEDKETKDFLFQDILSQATLIYEPIVRPLLEKKQSIRGIAHITGGGFYENIPRVLPSHLAAYIESGAWTLPQVFQKISQKAELDYHKMSHIFNMGVGMILIVPESEQKDILSTLNTSLKDNYPELGEEAFVMGKVISRKKEAVLIS